MPKKLTHDEFIDKLKDKNIEAFNELKFLEEFKTVNKKILVKNKYGTLIVAPATLFSGAMPTIQSAINKTKYFINKATELHGNKYDYSLVEYKNATTKVKIICNTCGYTFEKTPNKHFDAMQGCKNCSTIERSKKQRLSIEEFIKRSNEVHNNKYNYDNVAYKNAKTKVKIICPTHGSFLQTPDSHLSGSGCKKCLGYFDKQYALNNIARYEKYKDDLERLGVKCRKNKKDTNILEVQCYRCKEWFVPKYGEVRHKISASNNIKYGESNLYCSEHCKSSCPVFGFKSNNIDPKSKQYVEKTEQQQARGCQTSVLKQLQCNKHGYNYCERCGDIIDVELHHTLPIAQYGIAASDHESHILLCAGCHVKTHAECNTASTNKIIK